VTTQHPKVTVGWAVRGLEQAIRDLSNGAKERRVRAQLHQLLLALERDAHSSEIQGLLSALSRSSKPDDA
jgi:hypothetical protein